MVTEPTWEGILLDGEPAPIEFRGALPWRLPEDRGGTGILLRTNMGTIRCLFHAADSGKEAIIWVSGASGGFNGAGSLYPVLSDELIENGITSLRLSYRKPDSFVNCMLDVLVGIAFLREKGFEKVALVGHSLGGAVVIAAGALSESVVTVVGLASQTYGAQYPHLLAPKPILLVHGEDDTRLGPYCSKMIHELSEEPKELVLYPGAGHSLRECKDELHPLLKTWLTDKLKG